MQDYSNNDDDIAFPILRHMLLLMSESSSKENNCDCTCFQFCLKSENTIFSQIKHSECFLSREIYKLQWHMYALQALAGAFVQRICLFFTVKQHSAWFMTGHRGTGPGPLDFRGLSNVSKGFSIFCLKSDFVFYLKGISRLILHAIVIVLYFYNNGYFV